MKDIYNYTITSKYDKVIDLITSVLQFLRDEKKQVDNGLIYLLESNYDRYIRCDIEINETSLLIEDSKGNLQKNPLIKVQTDAGIQMLKCLNDLNVTPKQRFKSDKKAQTNTLCGGSDAPIAEIFKNIEMR